MQVAEALGCLGEGHLILSVDVACNICYVLGVGWAEDLVMSWESEQEAVEVYGFCPRSDSPGLGVDSLHLSYYVARVLGVGTPGSRFLGRGRQARANVQAIAQVLG